MKSTNFIILFFTFFLFACNKQAPKQFPKPIGHTNDFENILSQSEIDQLDSIIKSFKNKTTNQIAIITTDSIQPFLTIKEYSTAIGNEWGVGQKDKNNGLIIVVSQTRREVQITTGLGTEKIITNSMCDNIIQQHMLPKFSEGNMFKGIESGLLTIIDIWEKSDSHTSNN